MNPPAVGSVVAVVVGAVLSLVPWWLPGLVIFVVGVALLLAHDHREAKHRLGRCVNRPVPHLSDDTAPVVVVMAPPAPRHPAAIEAPMVVDA